MNFQQWFAEKWREHDGLISQTTAAKMLELSLARIYRLRKEGKIRWYVFKNDKTLYLSKSDVDALVDFYETKRRLRRGHLKK